MTTIDTARLRALAEKQSAAYSTMLEYDEGVGGLGVRHPEMLEDMRAWDDLSENGHADTVLDLLDELERLRGNIGHHALAGKILGAIHTFGPDFRKASGGALADHIAHTLRTFEDPVTGDDDALDTTPNGRELPDQKIDTEDDDCDYECAASSPQLSGLLTRSVFFSDLDRADGPGAVLGSGAPVVVLAHGASSLAAAKARTTADHSGDPDMRSTRDPGDYEVEAGCVAFYEGAQGITSWERMKAAEPELANRYRDGIRAALLAAQEVRNRG